MSRPLHVAWSSAVHASVVCGATGDIQRVHHVHVTPADVAAGTFEGKKLCVACVKQITSQE